MQRLLRSGIDENDDEHVLNLMMRAAIDDWLPLEVGQQQAPEQRLGVVPISRDSSPNRTPINIKRGKTGDIYSIALQGFGDFPCIHSKDADRERRQAHSRSQGRNELSRIGM